MTNMANGNVLVVEADTTYEAADFKSAAQVTKKEEIDVIVCDVLLPDGNGIEFTKRIKHTSENTEIILLTANGNIHDSVQAMRNGAFDYITKGDDNDKVIPLVSNAMTKARLRKRVEQLERQASKDFSFDTII